MLLTGDAIYLEVLRGRIVIEPFSVDQLGANSYDVRLAPTLYRVVDDELDFKRGYAVEVLQIPDQGLTLEPDELYLGATVERTVTPFHVPIYEGRSTTGRYFLQSHQTAGFGDIGFAGHWTLEITVRRPTVVYPNMRIGQIGFDLPYGRILKTYGGRYSTNAGRPTPKVAAPNNI